MCLCCGRSDSYKILALHRECAGGGLEDSMGVNEVEWATPSGPLSTAPFAVVTATATVWERKLDGERDCDQQNIGRVVRRVC